MDHDHSGHNMDMGTTMSMASATIMNAIASSTSHSGAMATSTASSMSMGGKSTCKISMLWNWHTVDTCFISSTWHNTSHSMFGGSCAGVVFLVIALELLRRLSREFDRYVFRTQLIAARRNPNNTITNHSNFLPTRFIDSLTSTFTNNKKNNNQPTDIKKHSNSSLDVDADDSGYQGSNNDSSKNAGGCQGDCNAPIPGAIARTSTLRPTIFQRVIRAFFYAWICAGAYMVMLLAMYYNGYIFISIMLGFLIGHFLFCGDISIPSSSDITETGCC